MNRPVSAPTPVPATDEDHLIAETLGGEQRLTLVPATSTATGVVGVLPALGVRAGYYSHLATALAGHGLHTVLADLPGNGESPLRASRRQNWGYRELLERHLPAVRAAIGDRFPGLSLHWLGHSIGGQLALIDAGRFPEAVDRVIVVASGAPYFRAWPTAGALALLSLSRFAVLTAAVCGHFPGDRIGFAGREARRLMSDWGHIVMTGRYDFDGFDAEKSLAACSRPILAVTLAGDRFAPQASVDHSLEKTASTEITRWTWSSDDGPLDHNRWPRTPEAVVERMIEWMRG